ncbi:MAG TPA: ABC transporter substrate-binding protein [Saprospiraceae bacterium]|nr:ABC transporter substrate-binding protein [Saprospiraceae bacterium]
MNNNWGRLALLAATLIAAFFLLRTCSGCQGGTSTQPFTLNVRMEAPATVLNPYMPATGYSNFVAMRIFQSLGDFDPITLDLKPLLVKRIPEARTVTEGPHQGQLAYDFEVNELATWDNGSPVTARDVEFSLKLIFHPGLPTLRWRGFFEYVESIEFDPANPRKFTVFLKQYYMLGLESLCQFPIYPAYHYDAQGHLANIPLTDFLNPAKAAELSKNPTAMAFADEFQQPKYKNDPAWVVGSGPYRLETMSGEQGLTLLKKQNWWGDKASEQYPLLAAYPARINYQVVLEEPAIENMLRNEQLDLAVDMSPVNFRRLEKDPDLSAKYDFLTNWTTRYNRWVFNMTNPKLKDQRVRQALAYLVNYNDLVQNIQLGLAQRMIGPINPRKGYYNKSLKPYDYNVEEAKRLLAEAGWTDSNNDGTVDKEIDGKRVELTLDMLTTPASKVAEMVGNSIAQSASVGGVKINIVPLSIKELGDLTRGGKFETAIFASAQHSGWADMFQNYHSGSLASLGGDNRNFFADSTFDQAVVKIRTTPDTSARYAPYMEAQRILHEMLPEVVLYTSDYRYIVAKKYRYLLTPNRPGYQEQMFQQR